MSDAQAAAGAELELRVRNHLAAFASAQASADGAWRALLGLVLRW